MKRNDTYNNQMVTSEIKKLFETRVVQNQIKNSGNYLIQAGQNASEIIPIFHESTIWLAINIYYSIPSAIVLSLH